MQTDKTVLVLSSGNLGCQGLPLPPALCSWEWDSPEPGESPLLHISMRRKGGKRNKGNTHQTSINQSQVCDLVVVCFVRKGLFCEKALARVMRVIRQWLVYNGIMGLYTGLSMGWVQV